MADLSILAGATSQSILVDLYVLATGAAQTGLAYNSSGLTAYYSFAGTNATSTAITLATLSTVTAAWSSGGFKELDGTNMPGVYRFDLPNAVIAASKGREVIITFTGYSGMATRHIKIELTAVDNQSTAFGLVLAKTTNITGLNDIAATAIVSNGAITTSSGKVAATVASGDGADAASIKATIGTAGAGLTALAQSGSAPGWYTAPANTSIATILTDLGGLITTVGTAGAGLTALAQAATALSTATWTASLAGYLNNLNIGGPVASHADITGLNTASPNARAISANQYLKPASGTTTYPVTLLLLNDAGQPTDADGGTITDIVQNATGTDRSSNFSGWTHAATGRYEATYSVSSSATDEPLVMRFTGTVGGQTFTAVVQTLVADAFALDFNSTDRSNLTAVFNKLPVNDIADETLLLAAVSAIPTTPALAGSAPSWWVAPDNSDIATIVTSVGSGLHTAVVALGSPMQAGATVKATDTSGAALATHADASTIEAAITSLPSASAIAVAVANESLTVGTLPSPPPTGYGPGNGAGTTAVTDLAGGTSRSPSTMTVVNGSGQPIMGAIVQAYAATAYAASPATASVLGQTTTDANGHWTLNLPTGTGACIVIAYYPGVQTSSGSVTV